VAEVCRANVPEEMSMINPVTKLKISTVEVGVLKGRSRIISR
jgi:hypothetical protein